MSRAVSVVSRKGSRAWALAGPGHGREGRGSRQWQPRGGRDRDTLVSAGGGVPQVSGSLAPVPRGSKLTMSNRWRTAEGSRPRMTGRIWFPLSAGPPGLNNSIPPGSEGSSAGARLTANVSCGPSGCR